MPKGQALRPHLVRVYLNQAAKVACLEKTGATPDDVVVCCGLRCGALLEALKALAPLQELIK